MKKITLFVCISIICCFTLNPNIWAQQIQRPVAISAYIYNFVKNVRWQNEEAIKEFHFLVIGDDKNVFRELQKLSKSKTIRDKPIIVSYSSKSDNIENVQLIFVTKSKEKKLVEIFDKIEGKNILLVTDNYQDKGLIMINFFDSEKGTLQFEINKANIINQHISIMPDMILLGGTEVDVMALYYEGQQSLRSLQKHSENLENNLSHLESIIATNTKEIREQKDSLNRQTQQIKEQQKTYYNQTQLLNNSEKELVIQTQKITEQKTILDAQFHELEKQKADLKKGNKLFLDQEKKINRQKSEILLQSKILKGQGTTIHRQQNLVFLLSIITILVAVLVFSIYRGYKTKQQLNKQLEKRVEERTNELNILNEQLQVELTERKQAEVSLRRSEERYRFYSNAIRHQCLFTSAIILKY
ncbi:MAG: YfiR/HmsC family protein [Lentimicrobiaceae bacterium]|nr:YfiR/HmsC family protein [Lentimicrobiaceae bacterium]